MENMAFLRARPVLSKLQIRDITKDMDQLAPTRLQHNLPPQTLLEHAVAQRQGQLTTAGALVVLTGSHTGRSPQDKFIVDDAQSHDQVWWGTVNKPFTPAAYAALRERVIRHLSALTLYQQDLSAGADAASAIALRLITPSAWHALFASNIFRAALPEDKSGFTIFHAPDFKANLDRDATRSETFVIINFTAQEILIGGTHYAGEIKKAIFTVMNYLLPAQGILPMHCSANVGMAGDSALFFGLSGTGKTTLSADPARRLVGDDEHGWSAKGIFNIEGGCYAKAINLSAASEPQIYAACERSGTVLENVLLRDDKTVDYSSDRYTENTRACYPVRFIDNIVTSGIGQHPRHIVFLTCDAFGVLPPISKLTREQALYHFLSGYTARVAGTELGVTEPTTTFSACFGAPFLPRPPQVYAEMLGRMLDEHPVTCWLLNTGWSGGAAGTGARMPLSLTRQLLNAALSDQLQDIAYTAEPFFGLHIPNAIPQLPGAPLNARDAWADKETYDKTARHLAGLFAENYKKFS